MTLDEFDAHVTELETLQSHTREVCEKIGRLDLFDEQQAILWPAVAEARVRLIVALQSDPDPKTW